MVTSMCSHNMLVDESTKGLSSHQMMRLVITGKLRFKLWLHKVHIESGIYLVGCTIMKWHKRIGHQCKVNILLVSVGLVLPNL